MLYADASALVKLAYAEAESAAVERLFLTNQPVASSKIVAVEVVLTARRAAGDAGAERAQVVIEGIELLEVDDEVVDLASRLERLRALDAIHLATALSIRTDLDGFVAYDRRLAAAAEANGLRILAPA